ncbi:ATP-binding cassette domain-containing protein [Candidatus Cetobacterium colombiensis]|jgi:energy-coupling factor transport system ATP-binding protein|uniref:ATP-binding cassette domain-containing protein n=1 Tax=Candidatus Cetobacterium colombiensis TaxID=3073100 RepID=A0ABU4WAD6_9FUSO|nr:ATP-binding cassette domain-containing protein [Candidatus Cetobacterium colombiensis]MDX8336110.1 ATP-binding cassette domain-containing protein [Candidatus Cetobacterium colombiensis]
MEITLKNINSGYSEIVLENINLEIKKGTWNFIVGKTGSGKSTLLQTIGFLLTNIQGEIFWKDLSLADLKNLKKYRENIGFMFQYTDKQFFNNTVKEEIIYSLVKKKKSLKEIEEKLEEVLNLLKISKNILQNSPYEISGGQKRMVAFASILIDSPKILLLDEPTAGLDVENKKIFFETLEKLKKEGVTILQISHLLEDVLDYGDETIVLENRKIIQKGKPIDVLKNSDLEFIRFCRVIEKYGIPIDNIKNIDELLERIKK